mgnify:CR=1 FL=1
MNRPYLIVRWKNNCKPYKGIGVAYKNLNCIPLMDTSKGKWTENLDARSREHEQHDFTWVWNTGKQGYFNYWCTISFYTIGIFNEELG